MKSISQSSNQIWCLFPFNTDLNRKKIKFNLAVSKMQILNDADTIPFMIKKQVSLPLLKHEIDRRILKITTILKRKKGVRQEPNLLNCQDQEVQTQDIGYQIGYNPLAVEQSNVLCPSKSFDPNQPNQEEYKLRIKKSPKRLQIPLSKNNSENRIDLRQSNKFRCLTCQTQIEQPEIENNRFTFRGNRSSFGSQYRSHQHQQGENDYIFEKIDFATQLSTISNVNYKNKSSHNSDQCNDNLKSQETLMSFHTDFSGSERAKMDPIQRRKNTRRARIMSKELTVSEAELRIAISNECLERMKATAEELVNHRRKELWDSKVRLNMLKKIEQRYGELNST